MKWRCLLILQVTFWGVLASAARFDCSYLFWAVSNRHSLTEFHKFDEAYFQELADFKEYVNEYQPLKQSRHEARTNEKIWSSHYFPKLLGGVAARWQLSLLNPYRYKYSLLKIKEPEEVLSSLRAMNQKKIAKFSPAEKLDIFMGNYNFPITKFELKYRGPLRTSPNSDHTEFVASPRSTLNPFVEFWRGYCNGVCAAGVEVPEPRKPITVTNRDGLEIRFEVADIKALYAAYFLTQDHGLTLSLNFSPLEMSLFLDKWMLDQMRPFFADLSNTEAVWNKTVVGVKRELNKGSEAMVEGKFHFEFVNNGIALKSTNRVTHPSIASGKSTKWKTYSFQYELDQNGRVLSSRWTGARPKSVWFGSGDRAPESLYNNPFFEREYLETLLEASI